MAYGPRRYVHMAKGLARSIRLHNRSMPIAIVSDRKRASLASCFDVVIPVNPGFGPGLAQKLHLDAYTPFDQTLFIDSDFLCFRDPQIVWDQFSQSGGFGLAAYPMEPGDEHYAVDDLPQYMSKLGLSRMLMTNTGVLFFDRSDTAKRVFETAREIAGRGEELGLKLHPVGFFNDEPIFASAVELLGLPFVPAAEAPFTLAGLGTDGMMEVDVRRKLSRYTADGENFDPALIHFNVWSQNSRVYDRELRRLAFGRTFGSTPLPDAVTKGLWALRERRGPRVIGRLLDAARSSLAKARSRGGGQPPGVDPYDPICTASAADQRIVSQAQLHSMTGPIRLLALVDAVRYCIDRGVPGAFAECGVWRGGSVLAMVLTLQDLGVEDRDIYLYDTFEGMTQPSQHDVSRFDDPALTTWQKAEHGAELPPWGHLFVPGTFTEEMVRSVLMKTGYPPDRLHFVRGPVEETLPDNAPESLALLRLDTDWYESTHHELTHLFPSLEPGGVLIIDDYGHWEGARRAVDEYLQATGSPLLLHRIDYSARAAVKC